MKTTNQPPAMMGQLTESSVGLHLFQLSVPMLFSLFMGVAFNLTDTYFVAQLGTDRLAAMSFTFPVVATIGTLAAGLGNGATSVVALAIGEGKRDQVKRLIRDSLILSLVISVVFTLVALATMRPIFTALGARPDVLALTVEYMKVWYFGLIFVIVPAMAMNIIRASGNVKILSLIMILAPVINVVLDPFLIFGWAGFPRLELRGAALATVFSQATMLFLGLLFLYRNQMICLTLPKFRAILKSWKDILSISIPLAITSAIKPISMGVISSVIAFYGSQAIAAFGLAVRLESCALMAFLALSASIAPIVGQNWGAGKFERVKRAFSLSLRFCLIWGGLAAIALGFAAPGLTSLFDSNREVISIVATYMMIVPISYAAVGIIEISSSTFIALGKPMPSVAMTLANTLLLYVPLAALGSRLFGISGVFAAACVSNVIVALGALFWNRRTWHVVAAGANNTSVNSQ
jgi:putative MATE family efflux protein